MDKPSNIPEAKLITSIITIQCSEETSDPPPVGLTTSNNRFPTITGWLEYIAQSEPPSEAIDYYRINLYESVNESVLSFEGFRTKILTSGSPEHIIAYQPKEMYFILSEANNASTSVQTHREVEEQVRTFLAGSIFKNSRLAESQCIYFSSSGIVWRNPNFRS